MVDPETFLNRFVPEQMMPAQWKDNHTNFAHVSAERRLMLAVLVQAIADVNLQKLRRYRGYGPAAYANLDQLINWFFKPSDAFFGFETICQSLGLEVGPLQQAIACRGLWPPSQFGRNLLRVGTQKQDRPIGLTRFRATRHRWKKDLTARS
jgi:hypothetical protein